MQPSHGYETGSDVFLDAPRAELVQFPWIFFSHSVVSVDRIDAAAGAAMLGMEPTQKETYA